MRLSDCPPHARRIIKPGAQRLGSTMHLVVEAHVSWVRRTLIRPAIKQDPVSSSSQFRVLFWINQLIHVLPIPDATGFLLHLCQDQLWVDLVVLSLRVDNVTGQKPRLWIMVVFEEAIALIEQVLDVYFAHRVNIQQVIVTENLVLVEATWCQRDNRLTILHQSEFLKST